MKKIVFGITSLQLGGAERILVDLANALTKYYEVTIFTLYGEGEFEKELSDKVHLVQYYQTSFSHTSFRKRKLLSLKLLRKGSREKLYQLYFKDYDIKIAFLEGPMTLLMSCGAQIAWVHNDIQKVFGEGLMAKKKYKVYENVYQKYPYLVFVSKDNLTSFENFYQNHSNKRVIYNYLDEKKVIEKSKKKIEWNIARNELNFLVVARLTPQKGLSRLLDVHHELMLEGLSHQIYVIGDGPLKEKLEDKIKTLQVDGSFHLLGKKENPYPYMEKADVFLLPSLYEGYGMVLVEAKILNKFIVATNTAAKEVIEAYDQSLLVENSHEGLKKGMAQLIRQGIRKKEKKNLDSSRKSLSDVMDLIEEVE